MVKCILCGGEFPICGICNTDLCGAPVCVKHAPIIAKVLRGHNASVSLE